MKRPGYPFTKKALIVKGTTNFIVLAALLYASFHLSIATAYFHAFVNLEKDKKQITATLPEVLVVDTEKINTFVEAQKTCVNVTFSERKATESVYRDQISATKPYSNFYKQWFLPEIVPYLGVSLPLSDTKAFLHKDSVFILESEPTVMTEISSSIAKNLIRCNIEKAQEISKKDPQLLVMNENDYVDYIKSRLDDLLKKENDAIKEANETIKDIENYLGQLKKYYASYKSKTTAKTIADTEKLLERWKDYRSELERDKASIIRKIEDPQDEVGHYFYPDVITVMVEESDKKYPQVYMSTLLHENLHYMSDVNGKYLDSFFEEGLTQTLTREILNKKLKLRLTTSYPIPVYVISQMMNKIPSEKFVEIYFSKDQEQLEKTIDTAYGADFYKRYKATFQAIFNNTTEESITKTNELLQEMGAEPLTLEKLQHTEDW